MKTLMLICLVVCTATLFVSAQTWTDISTAEINSIGGTPGGNGADMVGCAGVTVNRLTGDVVINITTKGLYRSSNMGTSWTRIDQNTVGAKSECGGGGINTCQDNPVRMALFGLDGSGSGYTPDGVTWKKINVIPASGRGFDFGSVNWDSPTAKVMLATQHSDGASRNIYKSTDGGSTWVQLSAMAAAVPWGGGTPTMVGVIDSVTFIYCSNNTGIMRSTDQGANWSKVSSINPLTVVPVLFKGKYYLGTPTGVIVSADKGATWQALGATLTNVYRGPFFGADENTMVVITCTGDNQNGTRTAYKTTNGGTTWTSISAGYPAAYQGSEYTLASWWYSCWSWDPINNVLYASSMSNPAYKKALGPVNSARGFTALSSERRTFCLAAGRPGSLTIDAEAAGRVSIYSPAGILIDAFSVRGGAAVTREFSAPGIYLVRFSSVAASMAQSVMIR